MAVANQMRQRLHNLRDEPYNIVKEQVVRLLAYVVNVRIYTHAT